LTLAMNRRSGRNALIHIAKSRVLKSRKGSALAAPSVRYELYSRTAAYLKGAWQASP
jgi:hypothetical protein